MPREVKAFKLSSGEEIIARVEEDNEDTYVLDHPNMIGLVPAADGSGVAIQLMPWLAANQDGKATVNKRHIIAEVVPDSRLERGFLERTSGIQMLTR